LNRFCTGHQINHGIGGVAPDRDPPMLKQVYQQGNGRRTDPPNDFKSHLMQLFIIPSVE
jgi:hypothetical protein